MPKFIQSTNNFLLGEVSTRIFGRTEIDQYRNACEVMKNALTYQQGGAAKRMGSIFVSSTLSSQTAIRLIPFTISETNSYVIAIPVTGGNWYVYNALTDAFVNLITAPATSYSAADLPNVQYSQFDSVLIFTHPNYPPFVVQWAGGSSFVRETWIPETTGIAPGVGISTTPPGRSLARSLSSRRSSASVFPFMLENTNTGHYIRIDNPSGSAPIAYSTAVGVFSEDSGGTGIPFFETTHVGAIFKFTGAGVTGAVELTTYVSSTQFTGRVLEEVSTETRQNEWKESAWSPLRGYPRVSGFYEGRLMFGGTKSEPDRICFSESFDLVEFEAPAPASFTATSPFDHVLNTGSPDPIQWLFTQKNITVGTLSNEVPLVPADQNVTITGANLPVSKPSTYFGSRYVQVTSNGDSPVFVDASGVQIREFIFNEAEDQYNSTSLSLLSEHIFRRSASGLTSPNEPRVVALQFQKSKHPTIWMIDSNGGLVACRRDRQYNVQAFSHHVLGGSYDDSNPRVESIACVRAADNVHYDLWMVVLRTINGSDVRYIERIGREFLRTDLYNASTSINDKPVFVDSAKIVIAGAPATVFAGFTHLVGEEVAVLADGEYVGLYTVDSSGQITLPENKTEVIAGLPFTAEIKTVPIEAGGGFQSSQGSHKRIDRVHVKFFQTGDCNIGVDADHLQEVIFREATDPVDEPVPLFTGLKTIVLECDYEIERPVLVRSSVPLPLSINAIIAEGQTND